MAKCFAIPSSFVKFMVTSAIPFAICYKIFHSISSTNPTRMCKTCSSVILSIYLQYVKKYEYSNKPRQTFAVCLGFIKSNENTYPTDTS